MKQIQSNIWEFKRLTWKQDINHVALKLNKANAMLSKLRHLMDIKTLRSVYYAIFEPYVECYVSAMLHLFGHKTLIQLKGFTYYRKSPSD